MKIMFMGTPDFAVVSLRALKDAGNEICAVVTMPDKPRGRGHKMAHTPVYEAASEYDIPVYTPENLKKETFEEILQKNNPEVIVVVAYGKILPEYVLSYPKYGCINVHGSLLPKYRGAAPIQRSIIDGCKATGVTTMYMEKGLDTGDMLLKEEVEITEEDNFETLHDKLANIGANLIVKTLDALKCGTCTPQKQNDEESSYAHMITKETCLIDWSKEACIIHNQIRGLSPFPKAFTYYNSKQMKILSSKTGEKKHSEEIGRVLEVTKDYFTVSCGNGTILEIHSIQPEGKKVMSVSDYLKGNSIDISTKLGVID